MMGGARGVAGGGLDLGEVPGFGVQCVCVCVSVCVCVYEHALSAQQTHFCTGCT